MLKKTGLMIIIGLLVLTMGMTVSAEEKKREYSDELLSFNYTDEFAIDVETVAYDGEDYSKGKAFRIFSPDNGDIEVSVVFVYGGSEYGNEDSEYESFGEKNIVRALYSSDNLDVYKALRYKGLENAQTDYFTEIFDSIKLVDNIEEVLGKEIAFDKNRDCVFQIPWGTPMAEIAPSKENSVWEIIESSEDTIKAKFTGDDYLGNITITFMDTNGDGLLDKNMIDGEDLDIAIKNMLFSYVDFLSGAKLGYIDADTWTEDGEERENWGSIQDVFESHESIKDNLGFGATYDWKDTVGTYEDDTKMATWEISQGSGDDLVHVHYEGMTKQ